MIWLLFSSLSMASVVLVPKPGATPQKQIQMPFEQPSEDDSNLEVQLRKIEPIKKIKKKKTQKFAKNKKSKKKKIKNGKKQIPEQSSPAQEEDADFIYENKVQALNVPKATEDNRYPDAVPEDGHQLLEQVEKKYTSNFIQMKLSKQVTQAILDRTKEYSGTLALGPKGLLKMTIIDPQKSDLILDGKNIWVVDYPVDDMQNKVQILHTREKKNLKEQAFLGSLLSGGGLLKNFKIEKQTSEKDETKFKLIPKEKGFEIKSLELSVDVHDQLITDLAYWDQLGNKTELKFKDQEFKTEVPKDFFKFEPPKNSDINEL